MGWLTSLARDDRFILATLGVGTAGLLVMMYRILENVRDDVEIKPEQPKTQYITQETEDALRLGTLDTLLGHYNYAIRETASRIVCDRAINDGTTLDVLLYGITRPDYDERMKNLRCLAIVVTDHQTLHLLHTWKAYAALVRCLELGLEENGDARQKLDDRFFDEYYLRDLAERLCLMFISQLVRLYDAEKLIKAGFVEKWLARQYWGDTPEETLRNFRQYMDHRQNSITEVVGQILKRPTGRRRLREAGLMRGYDVDADADGTDSCGHGGGDGRFRFALSISMGNNDEDGGDGLQGQLLMPVEVAVVGRAREHSAEEQRLRHRHREAMVFNDGTSPLNSDDIFQRDHASPT
ncbi:hypothetical protein VTK73DRAFT_8146 [Phialemonium thermophilum]|uniref:Cytoskeleton-associated protein n=1 Tax=Phialemonium thermophilum TaxID=223376 RepID=A0ABR3WAV2_9PEZI